KLFFEKSVNSFPSLMQEVDWLDLDSGIRAEGMGEQFVFVTRSPQHGYTLMVYGKKPHGKGSVPDKRLLVKEFRTKELLGDFMRGLLAKPVLAYVY
ncbi:MAG: hypothetical protein OK454_07445, partial [Thaumarchaeota archaeon]|nr:hypothetical protein [Nitrososphaerota archaeon]